MPKRIQRKRAKGFKLETDNPLGYVMIHRPFKLGNPFDWTVYVGMSVRLPGGDLIRATPEIAKEYVVKEFKNWLLCRGAYSHVNERAQHQLYLKELEKHRGKDVVCFCKLDQACHGDVILWYWEETK